MLKAMLGQYGYCPIHSKKRKAYWSISIPSSYTGNPEVLEWGFIEASAVYSQGRIQESL